LEYVDNAEDLYEKEEFYINYFKFIGCDLLNHYSREFQSSKESISVQARAKISQETKKALDNPEMKEFFRQNAYKTIAGYNKGKKFSQEFKDKIKKSQEHKAWKFEIKGSICIGFHDAAKAIGCSVSAINHYVQGRTSAIYGNKYRFWR